LGERSADASRWILDSIELSPAEIGRARRGVTRREFLSMAAALGLALPGGSALLSGCSGGAGTTVTTTTPLAGP
jgi:hypothetical protein